MGYVLISLVWAVLLLVLLYPRQQSQLSSYSKSLEELGKLIPESIDRIGHAIQSNLYPSLSVPQSVDGRNGEGDAEAPEVFEAVKGPILDWEELAGTGEMPFMQGNIVRGDLGYRE